MLPAPGSADRRDGPSVLGQAWALASGLASSQRQHSPEGGLVPPAS